MRKLRQTKAGANETLGQVTQRRDESAREPVPAAEVEFTNALTRLRQFRCGGGVRVIRKNTSKE